MTTKQLTGLFCTAFLIVPMLLVAQGSWEKLPSPFGLDYEGRSFTQYNGRIYLVTSTGLYRSQDEGRNWESLPLPPLPSFQNVQIDSTGAILLSGNGLRIGPDPYTGPTLFKSVDEGKNWLPITTVNKRISNLIVASDGSYVFERAQESLVRSTDGGDTWKPVEHTLPIDSTSSVLAIGKFPNGDLIASYQHNKVFYEIQSTDNGLTWTGSKAALSTGYYTVTDDIYYSLLIDPQSIHLDKWICRHVERGGPCTQKDFLKRAQTTLSIAQAPDQTLYFMHDRIFTSTDLGITWDSGTRLPGFTSQTLFAIGSRLLSFGRGGPYASDDGGQTWVPSNHGIMRTQIGGLVVFPMKNGSMLVAGQGSAMNEIQVNPLKHSVLTKPLPYWHSAPMFGETADQTLFIAYGANIWMRPNGSTEFMPLPRATTKRDGNKEASVQSAASSNIASMSIISDATRNMLLLGSKDIMEVYDISSSSWTSIDLPRNDPWSRTVTHIAITSDAIFASYDTAVYRLYLSDLLADEPAHDLWHKVLDLRVNDAVATMNGAGAENVLVFAWNELKVTTDNGDTWQTIPSPVADARYHTARLTQDGTVFASFDHRVAGSFRNDIYFAHIDDMVWKPLDTEHFQNSPVTWIGESVSGEIYATSESGAAYRLLIPSSVNEREASSFRNLSASVSPNPNAGNLNISVSTEIAASYDVSIYDMSGRIVHANGKHNLEAGKSQFIVDITGLPSGSYRCEFLAVSTGERFSVPVLIVR